MPYFSMSHEIVLEELMIERLATGRGSTNLRQHPVSSCLHAQGPIVYPENKIGPLPVPPLAPVLLGFTVGSSDISV
jgi:hypothetical protein